MMHSIFRSRFLLGASAVVMMLAFAHGQVVGTCPCSSAPSNCPVIADDGDGTCTLTTSLACEVWNCDDVSEITCELVTRSSLQFTEGEACGLVTSTVARPVDLPGPAVVSYDIRYLDPNLNQVVNGAVNATCVDDVCEIVDPIDICVPGQGCTGDVFVINNSSGINPPPSFSLSGNPAFMSMFFCLDSDCSDGFGFSGDLYSSGESFGGFNQFEYRSNFTAFNPASYEVVPFVGRGRRSLVFNDKPSEDVKVAATGDPNNAAKPFFTRRIGGVF